MISQLRLNLLNFRDGRRRHEMSTPEAHLDAAAEWLLAAQRGTQDDGISHSFDLRHDKWNPSYPETTGYAIETLYKYSRIRGKVEFSEAARRAADWEVSVQLADGAVMAGTVDALPATPTIFNTGQVLFGWVAALEYDGPNHQYEQAIRRAADWLVEAMDEDGAWRRFPSPFGPDKESAYNTRTAFGLARAAETLSETRYLEAAWRNVAYVVGKAESNGFLPDNCLQQATRPLVHTIAYSIRGLLEVGVVAGMHEAIDLSVRMARGVAAAQRGDGSIPGRLDRDWNAAADWICITGNCQMSLNWLRMQQLGITDEFKGPAIASNRFVMGLQDRAHPNPGIRGGIKGSHPIGGEYMRFRYPNWAAKFFMDALMLELECS
jgi:hypothetical protein